MINYTYKLSNLEVNDVDDRSNVVHTAFVTIHGADDVTGNEESLIEKFDLEVGNLESFTEYDNLTEEIVLSWIESDRFTGAENSIALLIQTKNEALVDKPLPWKVVVAPEIEPETIYADVQITGDTPDIEE